ncbi:LOW QUALITY PROTEIN: alkaline phosphatase, tissue-nonspecific isozyme-like [Gigantopelta aegis]|uniref:LOW QUALITY PROTEIN: alkaline phosphatase, tissue-nonspecific isozyme-like n=1 Tax=Gigantopelta aegis TaxID=1735272 RepID=UPI001B88A824|nr:LOW QUALITY PROTEIN: alkaline phosphatase, tissue-nonspecific isozyme-like [Gigantopelta aegis]
MDIATITAGRIFKGQKRGKTGEESVTTMESFPFVALSKTYNDNRQVPDSAGTATAFLCGVKANVGTLGLDSSVPRFDCAKQLEGSGHVTSILKWSKDEGKAVGIVTTARITHATPAASYAHSADRDWESPWDLREGNATKCPDVAAQLFDNIDIDVMMGGGRRNILLNTTEDPETGKVDKRQRTDGRDLIEEWTTSKAAKEKNATYVWNKGQLDAVDPKKTDCLLGLFASAHMQFELDRDNSTNGDPSIAEMTKKAIEILHKNKKGYFLLVEGGRIDHAHHKNSAIRALEDFVAFDNAISVAVEMTNEKDTLIVVTADHGHTFSIGGSQPRGNNILGLVGDKAGYKFTPYDNMPYTTLSYANGPSPLRKNLTGVKTDSRDYLQYNSVRMKYETHGGADVAIFARGPMSHLFHSVQEQNYIAHVMAYASCVGSNKKHCSSVNTPQGGSSVRVGAVTLVVCFLVVYRNANIE